jgi:hypothetical protein
MTTTLEKLPAEKQALLERLQEENFPGRNQTTSFAQAKRRNRNNISRPT